MRRTPAPANRPWLTAASCSCMRDSAIHLSWRLGTSLIYALAVKVPITDQPGPLLTGGYLARMAPKTFADGIRITGKLKLQDSSIDVFYTYIQQDSLAHWDTLSKRGCVLQLFILQYRSIVDKGLSEGRTLMHDPRVVQTFEITILWNMTTSIPESLSVEKVCGVLSSSKIYCPSAIRGFKRLLYLCASPCLH